MKLRKRFVHTTRSLSLSELIRKQLLKFIHQKLRKGSDYSKHHLRVELVLAAVLERRVEIFTNWRLGINLKQITNKKYSVILYDSGVCRQSNVIVVNIKVNQNGRRERGPKILPRIIRFFQSNFHHFLFLQIRVFHWSQVCLHVHVCVRLHCFYSGTCLSYNFFVRACGLHFYLSVEIK